MTNSVLKRCSVSETEILDWIIDTDLTGGNKKLQDTYKFKMKKNKLKQ